MDEPTAASADLDRLLRWEDAGGTWRVLGRRRDGVILSLCRCDGGEEADRFSTGDPGVLEHVAGRDHGGR